MEKEIGVVLGLLDENPTLQELEPEVELHTFFDDNSKLDGSE